MATVENCRKELELLKFRKPRKFENGTKVLLRIEVEISQAEYDIVSGYARGGRIVDIANANHCNHETVSETIRRTLNKMLKHQILEDRDKLFK